MNVDIFIKRLCLYGRHGVLPQEREVGANFYVTLTATADVSDEALLHDRLEGTVDYSKLVEVLEREMAKPSALLEHVAMRMASRVSVQRAPRLPHHIQGRARIGKGKPAHGSTN